MSDLELARAALFQVLLAYTARRAAAALAAYAAARFAGWHQAGLSAPYQVIADDRQRN